MVERSFCRLPLMKNPLQNEVDKALVGGKNIKTPHKKPKKRELTEQQKTENKALSSKRILIEQVIRLLKIFKMARERFRLHPETYEQVILTVCGLVRLRIGTVILPIPGQ